MCRFLSEEKLLVTLRWVEVWLFTFVVGKEHENSWQSCWGHWSHIQLLEVQSSQCLLMGFLLEKFLGKWSLSKNLSAWIHCEIQLISYSTFWGKQFANSWTDQLFVTICIQWNTGSTSWTEQLFVLINWDKLQSLFEDKWRILVNASCDSISSRSLLHNSWITVVTFYDNFTYHFIYSWRSLWLYPRGLVAMAFLH